MRRAGGELLNQGRVLLRHGVDLGNRLVRMLDVAALRFADLGDVRGVYPCPPVRPISESPMFAW